MGRREAGYSCRRDSARQSLAVLNAFHVEGDLGYGILLAKYAPDMNHVPEQYRAAQRGAIPQVALVFWSFRIMAGQ